MSHTYATLEVSKGAFDEIAAKLSSVGYEHAFDHDGHGRPVIDMHGIGLVEGTAQLCSVCGRPPHPIDDAECMPATKPLAQRLAWAMGEINRLRGVA